VTRLTGRAQQTRQGALQRSKCLLCVRVQLLHRVTGSRKVSRCQWCCRGACAYGVGRGRASHCLTGDQSRHCGPHTIVTDSRGSQLLSSFPTRACCSPSPHL
jgi:hypothetical protein